MARPMWAPSEPYAQGKVTLLRLISQSVKEGTEKLPSEEELAKLAERRVVIRDVLSELESRGYLTRWRGRGTLINVPVCAAQPRVDEEFSFQELFAARGCRLRCGFWRTAAPARRGGVAGRSENRPGEERLLMLERVFLGDGVPMIHSRVYFRGSNLEFDYQSWKNFAELTLNEFLELFCIRQPVVTLAEQTVETADAGLAAKLEVAVGDPAAPDGRCPVWGGQPRTPARHGLLLQGLAAAPGPQKIRNDHFTVPWTASIRRPDAFPLSLGPAGSIL